MEVVYQPVLPNCDVETEEDIVVVSVFARKIEEGV